jgi:hypothetical protein
MEQRAQRTNCMSSLRRNGVAAVSSQTGHGRLMKLLVWFIVLPSDKTKTTKGHTDGIEKSGFSMPNSRLLS